MKKAFLFLFCAVITTSIYSQEIKLSNTFGGDTDNLEGEDFLTFHKYKKEDDKTSYKNYTGMLFSDRVQMDFESDVFEGRVRFDIWNPSTPDEETEYVSPDFKLKGFGKINLGKYASLVAGNSYFSKFDIKAGELFALDTNPNYGKIIKSGLSLYSEIPFDEKGKTKLKLGTGIEYNSIFDSIENVKFDLGADFIYKNNLYSGFSLRSLNNGVYGKYSVFAGGKINDFKANAGFIYNNTDDDILPNEAKYSLSLSGRYKNDNLKLLAAADVVSGLNSQYLSTSKEKTKTYKNNAIPFMIAGKIEYEPVEHLTTGLNIQWQKMLKSENNSLITIYPNAHYEFSKGKYEVSGGSRIVLNKNTGNGITSFSFPVMFKVEF